MLKLIKKLCLIMNFRDWIVDDDMLSSGFEQRNTEASRAARE